MWGLEKEKILPQLVAGLEVARRTSVISHLTLPLCSRFFGLSNCDCLLLAILLSPPPAILSHLPVDPSASTRHPWSCCRPARATNMSARMGPSALWCSRSPPAAAHQASPAPDVRSLSPSTSWARTPMWNWPLPRFDLRPTSPYRCVPPCPALPLEGPQHVPKL